MLISLETKIPGNRRVLRSLHMKIKEALILLSVSLCPVILKYVVFKNKKVDYLIFFPGIQC